MCNDMLSWSWSFKGCYSWPKKYVKGRFMFVYLLTLCCSSVMFSNCLNHNLPLSLPWSSLHRFLCMNLLSLEVISTPEWSTPYTSLFYGISVLTTNISRFKVGWRLGWRIFQFPEQLLIGAFVFPTTTSRQYMFGLMHYWGEISLYCFWNHICNWSFWTYRLGREYAYLCLVYLMSCSLFVSI